MPALKTRTLYFRFVGGIVVLGLILLALFPLLNAPFAVGQEAAVQKKTGHRPLKPDEVNLSTSRIYVRVDKTGLGHEHAIEGRVQRGVVHLGASKNAGEIVFDMRSFVADTLEARRYIGLRGATSSSTQRAVNANMLGKDVLNVGRFPTATFQIDSALPADRGQTAGKKKKPFVLDGRLTLHGVTRRVRFVVETTPKKDFVHLRGGFALRQTDFGITPYSKAFGAIGVADKLTIYGEMDLATSE